MKKIGILRESRVPVERRVALLPKHLQQIQERYPNISFYVQPYSHRCISDEEYAQVGAYLTEDLSDCDILLGIKEVKPELLLPNKTYLFFSHTIKKQSHNKVLLQNILAKNIRLIDYECITNDLGERLIAFGRFAGLVGAYNTLRAILLRYQKQDLKPAYQCQDLSEIQQILKTIYLPACKIVITGTGRVGKGAVEIMHMAGVEQVSPQNFLTKNYAKPVFTALHSLEYHKLKENIDIASQNFYLFPQNYISDFIKYARVADVLITTHFWSPQAPKLFTLQEARQADFKIKVIGDISCDINGSVPCTVQTSTIDNPFYDYNPYTEQVEPPFSDTRNITIMAIDNLPCELPKDASDYFGTQFVRYVLPALLGEDKDGVLARATIAQYGELTPRFSYLADFVSL
ncbi:MAG: NAD(P)-dependent oxidoreductase [Microscillaceae bacterium]|nr:NAD(P)-dependent oxidoreductase [Microscillaceae bacterium]MDW8461259.1 NAD(P)-dependent oxidoreductase [Cytophagales bacterium]